MPKKWKLYPLGVQLIFKDKKEDKGIPVEVIDYLDIKGDEVVYWVKTDKGKKFLAIHSQLWSPEK